MPPPLELSDCIEIQSRRHLYAAAPADFGGAVLALPDAGGGATLLHLAAMPSPLMNRVMRLPGGVPLAPPMLARIRAMFRERGLPQFWLHAWDLPGHEALRDSLADLGGQLQGGWSKFLCDLDRVRPPPSTRAPSPLRVRRARPDEARLSGQIICASFGMPELLLPWMAAFAGRPQWQVYLACDADEVPVATGALLVDGASAWLGMGATLPAARGQGAQQLLLAARLTAARDAGCTLAGIETEAAEAGEVRHSLNNIRRAGFREVGVRRNYLFSSS